MSPLWIVSLKVERHAPWVCWGPGAPGFPSRVGSEGQLFEDSRYLRVCIRQLEYQAARTLDLCRKLCALSCAAHVLLCVPHVFVSGEKKTAKKCTEDHPGQTVLEGC